MHKGLAALAIVGLALTGCSNSSVPVMMSGDTPESSLMSGSQSGEVKQTEQTMKEIVGEAKSKETFDTFVAAQTSYEGDHSRDGATEDGFVFIGDDWDPYTVDLAMQGLSYGLDMYGQTGAILNGADQSEKNVASVIQSIWKTRGELDSYLTGLQNGKKDKAIEEGGLDTLDTMHYFTGCKESGCKTIDKFVMYNSPTNPVYIARDADTFYYMGTSVSLYTVGEERMAQFLPFVWNLYPLGDGTFESYYSLDTIPPVGDFSQAWENLERVINSEDHAR